MPRTTRAPGSGKRYALNMRTTSEVRDKLEAAAAASGRSLVQEVETRLERSFAQDSDVARLGQGIAGMMDRAGSAAARKKGVTGPWGADRWCYTQACAAAQALLGALLPKDGGEPPEITLDAATIELYGGNEERARDLLEAIRDHVGINVADYLLSSHSSSDFYSEAAAFQSTLGPFWADRISRKREGKK
jgi:hypothetical protein